MNYFFHFVPFLSISFFSQCGYAQTGKKRLIRTQKKKYELETKQYQNLLHSQFGIARPKHGMDQNETEPSGFSLNAIGEVRD